MSLRLILFLLPFAVGGALAHLGVYRLRLPRWSAGLAGALVGMIAGGLGALRDVALKEEAGLSPEESVALGGVLGLMGGLAIGWLDRDRGSTDTPGDQGEPASLIHRFLVIMTMGFCWLPIFGLAMGIAAALTRPDMSRRAGLPLRIATAVGGLTTLAFIIALMTVLTP